jgi:hypothetical protein
MYLVLLYGVGKDGGCLALGIHISDFEGAFFWDKEGYRAF